MEKHVLVKKSKSRRAKDNEWEDGNNNIFKDEAAIVNLHNNRVGRKVNKNKLKTVILTNFYIKLGNNSKFT